MGDPIVKLQNEMVCTYRQIKGCDHDCQKCNLRFEDIEIITALEAAAEALEKQKPKKPKCTQEDYGGGCMFPAYECPTCKKTMATKYWTFCLKCGQALDWSEM